MTPTGFTATFSEPFNPSSVSLYGAASSGNVAPSVIVTNGNGITVRGSLVINATDTAITFVATTLAGPNGLPIANVSVPGATSGILPPDTYNVDLSGTAFQTLSSGQLLDGNDSGAGGNDFYVENTPVNNSADVAVVVPAFARGPGQTVNVTNASAAIATLTESGTTVTVSTTAAHGLVAGEPVTISGTSQSGYNNTWYVASVPSQSTFTFIAASGVGSATGGTYTASSGIPLSLISTSTVTGVTSGQFTLTFDPTLLDVSGVAISPALHAAHSTWTLTCVSSPSQLSAGTAIIDFSNGGTGSLTVNSTGIVLGGLTATVPDAAPYKSKDLLHFTSVSLTAGGTSVPAVGADALHLVAYLGDADGNGSISSEDAVDIQRVSATADAGFAAYRLADPYIVGDVLGDGAADGKAVAAITRFLNLVTTPQLPPIPSDPSFTRAAGPDPTVSIPSALQVGADGSLTVPVNIDDAQPAGSTGMTQAVLALTYDPAVLSVSSSDVQLGSVPAGGSGWKLQSVVDQATGQIGVTIWSPAPIDSSVAGSLVTIEFHQSGLAAAGTTTIDLVGSVDPDGLGVIRTQVDDDQGPYTLTPAPAAGYNPQIDALVSLANGKTVIAAGFKTVNAYSTSSGTDTANLADTAGTDAAWLWSSNALMRISAGNTVRAWYFAEVQPQRRWRQWRQGDNRQRNGPGLLSPGSRNTNKSYTIAVDKVLTAYWS